MTSTLTFPDLPADHPLNTGKGIISLHGSDVYIDLPHKPDKHDRIGRTCRNCDNLKCRSDFKCGCILYGYDDPARNPRARAIKCRHFVHWRKAMQKYIF